jgi:hypothetical protein
MQCGSQEEHVITGYQRKQINIRRSLSAFFRIWYGTEKAGGTASSGLYLISPHIGQSSQLFSRVETHAEDGI